MSDFEDYDRTHMDISSKMMEGTINYVADNLLKTLNPVVLLTYFSACAAYIAVRCGIPCEFIEGVLKGSYEAFTKTPGLVPEDLNAEESDSTSFPSLGGIQISEVRPEGDRVVANLDFRNTTQNPNEEDFI